MDDNPKLCRMAREYVEPIGYQVDLAHTGPDGREGPSGFRGSLFRDTLTFGALTCWPPASPLQDHSRNGFRSRRERDSETKR